MSEVHALEYIVSTTASRENPDAPGTGSYTRTPDLLGHLLLATNTVQPLALSVAARYIHKGRQHGTP